MKQPNPPSRPGSGPKSPTHAQISQRAEQLWDQQGRPADRDDPIWLEAERQLLNESQAVFTVRTMSGGRRPATRSPSVLAPTV